ncbi:MAG: hypothetical protein GX808_14415 [Syntrophomonadaceae bacterium]|nr:hypothetical protein [Syntrophomonadaceae bacterium]
MKVFTAGSRMVSELCPQVRQQIDLIIHNRDTILVGDSIGIDRAIQDYCLEKQYRYVKIFAANGQARNNLGRFEVVNVKVGRHLKGFDYYAAKDLVMAEEADWGLMVWNGRSKGTLNDIIHMTCLKKQVLVYYTPDESFYSLKSTADVIDLLDHNEDPGVHEFFLKQLKRRK